MDSFAFAPFTVLPVVSIDSVEGAVEGGTVVFTLSRTDTSLMSTALSVGGTYTSDETEENDGEDEGEGPPELENPSYPMIAWPPDELTTTVEFVIPQNTTFDGPRTITLTIVPDSAYDIGVASGAATINDDDAPLSTAPDEGVCISPEETDEDPAAVGPSPATSADGVRYADGTVQVYANDLSSSGFGQSWGVDLGWTNSYGYDALTADGNGMVTNQIAYLRTDGTQRRQQNQVYS